jgi:hypothetical protein
LGWYDVRGTIGPLLIDLSDIRLHEALTTPGDPYLPHGLMTAMLCGYTT